MRRYQPPKPRKPMRVGESYFPRRPFSYDAVTMRMRRTKWSTGRPYKSFLRHWSRRVRPWVYRGLGNTVHLAGYRNHVYMAVHERTRAASARTRAIYTPHRKKDTRMSEMYSIKHRIMRMRERLEEIEMEREDEAAAREIPI